MERFMDKLLTAKELSEKLNLSISKLAIDRMKERGIPFIKWKGQGQRGAVRYPMSEVQAFMENNMKAKA
jgi:predicted DNA-binding transcriptional regulator AlpA